MKLISRKKIYCKCFLVLEVKEFRDYEGKNIIGISNIECIKCKKIHSSYLMNPSNVELNNCIIEKFDFKYEEG